MGRIFTIGEMLIDFLPKEVASLKEVSGFVKSPGGAPANVAVGAKKLGSESYFIGKFSNEPFGDFLLEKLISFGVNTKYTFKTDDGKTALAFVSNKEDGDREFSFYRDMSADMQLSEDDIKDVKLEKNDFISFCSVGLIEAPLRHATKALLKKANIADSKVLFDPNLRFNLWDNHDELKNTIDEFLKYTDIIKVSSDETEFITGYKKDEDVFRYFEEKGIKNIIITKGKDGVIAKFGGVIACSNGYSVKAVDTTGAGDSFVGAILYKLEKLDDIKNIKNNELTSILEFANKVAAIVTTRKGAMDSLPTLEEVENYKFI